VHFFGRDEQLVEAIYVDLVDTEGSLEWMSPALFDMVNVTGEVHTAPRLVDIFGRLGVCDPRSLTLMADQSYNQKLWILDFTMGATYPPS